MLNLGSILFLFLSIWHFKNMFEPLQASDLYFPMYPKWEIEGEGKNITVVEYRYFYKTPKDMLLNRISKQKIQ